jgi:hypothetical protein
MKLNTSNLLQLTVPTRWRIPRTLLQTHSITTVCRCYPCLMTCNMTMCAAEGCGASGWWTLPGTGLVGRICVSTTLYSGRPFDAWTTCRAIGARLCRLAGLAMPFFFLKWGFISCQLDFQQICMLTNPFSGSSSGFFSDHHFLQDTYWAWVCCRLLFKTPAMNSVMC